MSSIVYNLVNRKSRLLLVVLIVLTQICWFQTMAVHMKSFSLFGDNMEMMLPQNATDVR